MATATPQSSPSPSQSTVQQAKLIHNVSLGALVVCPIIILLPPRKFDIYTVTLLGGTFWGGNQIAYEYTGRSIVGRWRARMQSFSVVREPQLPEKAKEIQARLREEKAAMLEQQMVGGRLHSSGRDRSAMLEELGRKQEDERKEKERGLLEKVWMGSEGADWKAKRDQREREALEQGRGYGGLIMDQIWEVWNWGTDKANDAKEKDESATEERQETKKLEKK